MSIVRRIVAEKRGLLVPLAAALLINIAVYALVVYPLGVKSATSVDLASAEALVRGTSKADQELSTFYKKVLPASLDEARRMTYARLPALAKKANMRFLDRRTEPDAELERKSQLGRVRTTMTLEGGYESVRQFLYELETTPEFIIVDDVSLGQLETDKPVKLTLEVSTYYRQGPRGT
jgi:hypothetical protein